MPKPRGLLNNGNTCYFNATLQNLCRAVVFRKNLEHISTLWRQKNQVTLVNEETSAENGFLAKILCNVKKLLVSVRYGRLGKGFFLFLASLTMYKAGSTGVLVSTARWILEQPHVIRNAVQSVSDVPLHIVNEANCSMMTFEQYLDSLWLDERCYEPAVTLSVERPWFAVVIVAICLFGCRTRSSFKTFFSKVLSRFFEFRKRLRSSVAKWWPSSDTVILCCSGLLFHCIGRLMASPQPVYKCLVEQNPETMFVLFVMAPSACLLFYHLHPTDVLLSLFPNVSCHPEEPICVALAKLFADIDSESGTSCQNPQMVLEAICRRSKRFHGFNQQDSHELLRHLLDGIREEERNLKQGLNLTLVDKVFGGHFRTVYTCEACASPCCLHEPFLDISLPITLHADTLKEISDVGNQGNDTSFIAQQNSIEFLLSVFTRSEDLGKQYLCMVCNKASNENNYELTRGKKQTLICDPPAVLCVHIKRFRKTTGDFMKANDHVQFSEYLNLKPYLTSDCQRVGKNQEKVMYSLFGVVVHTGSLEGGHYTAYIKSQECGGQDVIESNTEEFLQQEGIDWDSLPIEEMDKPRTDPLSIQQNLSDIGQTKEWYYCSDSAVVPVDASDVFRQEAYLLFYERLS